jgi:hypothetical protein
MTRRRIKVRRRGEEEKRCGNDKENGDTDKDED